MPVPKEGESKDDFVSRCIPILIDEGKEQDEAVAQCNSLWEQKSMKQAQGLYAQAEEISDAWRAEYKKPISEDSYSYVLEVFSDHVIVEIEGEYFKVPYEESEDEIIFADRSDWQEVERQQEWIAKSLDEIRRKGQLILSHGGAIKALGNGKIGGHLVLFGNEIKTDLSGDFFTADTDYDIQDGAKSAVYYDHGLDPTLQLRKLGVGSMKSDDVGVWIEAQLEMRDEYEQAIYSLVEANKMGWSSGTAPHLIERVPVGKSTWIKKWPLGIDASLTVQPMEYRNQAIMLKSYLKSQRLDIKELLEGVGETSAVDLSEWESEHWTEALRIFMEVQAE